MDLFQQEGNNLHHLIIKNLEVFLLKSSLTLILELMTMYLRNNYVFEVV